MVLERDSEKTRRVRWVLYYDGGSIAAYNVVRLLPRGRLVMTEVLLNPVVECYTKVAWLAVEKERQKPACCGPVSTEELSWTWVWSVSLMLLIIGYWKRPN